MNEMLGNQYFMVRRYCDALAEFEEVYRKDPSNKPIRRKLIICYIKANRIDSAFELFTKLVEEDLEFIIKTDPIFDDCPCPEIIYELENSIETNNQDEKNLALGMLWLFCDIKNSIKYFSELPSDRIIDNILKKLQETKNHLKHER
jgi:pentatricopeptide repeat protein